MNIHTLNLCIEREIVIGDVGFKTWMSYGCDEK